MRAGILESKKYKSTPVIEEPNTFIGGVASTIPDAASLATKLGILESDISYFAINGSDVEVRINVDYNLNTGAFSATNITNILTSYIDIDNHCKHLGNDVFTDQSGLTDIKLEGVQSFTIYPFNGTAIGQAVFPNLTTGSILFYATSNLRLIYAPILEGVLWNGATSYNSFSRAKRVYIPNCTRIGGTDAAFNNGNFASSPMGVKIWVHPSMETINSGAPEADIAWAISNKGAEVFYGGLPNNGEELLTPPEAITNASIGEKYGTALQINFTPPTSVNTIDFYEVNVNGVKYQDIQNSGGYITGLSPSTTYNISIKAVDEFYNKSATSNVVTATTEVTDPYPINEIRSYYKFNGNANDSVGAKHGTAANVTYESALGGMAARLNGSAQISLPANILINPTELSFSFLVKLDDTAAEYRPLSLNNNTGGPYTSFRLNSGGVANRIGLLIYDGTDANLLTSDAYTLTNWVHIAGMAKENDRYDLAVNGSIVASDVSFGPFTQVATLGNLIGASRSGTHKIKGLIKGVCFWNKSLTASEVMEIATKQLSGKELI